MKIKIIVPVFICSLIFLLPVKNISAGNNKYRVKDNWDDAAGWVAGGDGKSRITLSADTACFGAGIKISYALVQGQHGWVQIKKTFRSPPSEDLPIVFIMKASGGADFEIKFIDKDGSVFGKKISLKDYSDWKQLVIYRKNLEYWWGGKDNSFSGMTDLQLAISGHGEGSVWLDEIGTGEKRMKSSFAVAGANLDPNRELPGISFAARRDTELIPEDPLILEWLKMIQDVSSPEKALLPSQEGNQAQTFNNALVAMAFILKGEKERAERILDFFAEATDRQNRCKELQNFFYKGEARGFYQHVTLKRDGMLPAYHQPGNADRWMGDMAWLLTAYKYYEKKYKSGRYSEITRLLKDLLLSWYRDADGGGGYIQHGWRKGDSKLHEADGHPEGNIDAYAVMNLCGETETAGKIKIWLDRKLLGDNLPLDLYTWRVLAYGKDAAPLLNTPDYDFRYRKILEHKGKRVMGFYPFADISADNIWLDGTGHIACAYLSSGNKERGYFYANQLDKYIIERNINGKKTHAIPYTANNKSGYEWVDINKGFVSVAAWYIFAKNGFNPLTLTVNR